MTVDSKSRFSDRVEDYIRHRPGYPATVLPWLARTTGFASDWTIADVGSGTGISSRLFLEHGNPVIGIEPNAEMRHAAERLLAQYPKFRSVDGSAESTGLAAGSVDMVVAGQAFHWFDPPRARAEFRQILKAGGWGVLIWNARRLGGSPLLSGYEQLLLDHGTDYQRVRHEGVTDEQLAAFYGADPFQSATFENRQDHDCEGLLGRLRSASYVPAPGRPGHDDLMKEAGALFDRHAENGKVTLLYDTRVYAGRLS